MSMCNNPFNFGNVVVEQKRYDELLHKEALLGAIERVYGRASDYAFRDMVGHLLKAEKKTVNADETEADS